MPHTDPTQTDSASADRASETGHQTVPDEGATDRTARSESVTRASRISGIFAAANFLLPLTRGEPATRERPHPSMRPRTSVAAPPSRWWKHGRDARATNDLADARARDDLVWPVNTVTWFVPFGLIIGLLWVGCFRGAWRIFGETASMRLIPSLSVVLLECLFTGALLVIGLARTSEKLSISPLHGPGGSEAGNFPPVSVLVLCLTVLCQFVLVLSLLDVDPWWPSPDDWRHHFNFIYPRPIYRPLLLAPIWGRWGILVAGTVGGPAPSADDETRAISRRMTPGRLLKYALLPAMLTAIYCSRSQHHFLGVVIAMLVFSVTHTSTVILARRTGGQTRQTLYATGQIAQIAFLALYRGFGRLIDA